MTEEMMKGSVSVTASISTECFNQSALYGGPLLSKVSETSCESVGMHNKLELVKTAQIEVDIKPAG